MTIRIYLKLNLRTLSEHVPDGDLAPLNGLGLGLLLLRAACISRALLLEDGRVDDLLFDLGGHLGADLAHARVELLGELAGKACAQLAEILVPV